MFILRLQVKGLESEVRYQLTEARIVLRRRSVIPLMVRQSSCLNHEWTQAHAHSWDLHWCLYAGGA